MDGNPYVQLKTWLNDKQTALLRAKNIYELNMLFNRIAKMYYGYLV